ncbi:hypothetical protein AAEX28_11545 [Lentisphaerota bacterium WC36G]|nr:hypothetical protein LJT99_14380 [Lentisphaerae bacterium WC36]
MDEKAASRNDYKGLYREINGRVAQFLNSYHNDELLLQDAVYELKKINDYVRAIEKEMQGLELKNSQANNLDNTIFEQQFERLERIRLDLIKYNCEVESLLPYRSNGSTSAASSNNANFIHELISLNKLQLIRMGFFFMLPFIIGVMVAILFLGLMLRFAWGG